MVFQERIGTEVLNAAGVACDGRLLVYASTAPSRQTRIPWDLPSTCMSSTVLTFSMNYQVLSKP